MRFNRLDLNLLVALDALLTERNISRAAEKVNLSQSTMSHALARLREHFKDDLLVQVGRKMELTPRAETLRDPIRDVLVRISTTIDTEPGFDPSKSDREFVLHVSDYSMEVLFPHLLALADQQHSRVRFKLLPQVGSPTRALERGEVDLMLIPEAYCSPDHPMDPVLREEFACVTWTGSPLSKNDLTIEQYVEARHVVMEPPGSVSQPAFEHWFVQRYGISRNIAVSTYSFTAMCPMVVGTNLIATVHGRLAHAAARNLPLRLHPVPLPMPVLVQTMQWHKYRTQDPGLSWLRAALKEAALRLDGQAVPAVATGSAPAPAEG